MYAAQKCAAGFAILTCIKQELKARRMNPFKSGAL
jgi:hypothetical protein